MGAEETTVVKIDPRGRVQLPQALREALKIEEGGLARITVHPIVERP